MCEIKLPPKLKDQLARSDLWLARTTKLCANVSEILKSSPEFFPNYTLHGAGHINEVLKHASNLITKESFSSDPDNADARGLSPRDVAYLVSAIVIHDLGMFLFPDGVRSMLRGEWDPKPIAGCASRKWGEEWDAYISRAKRYSAEKKIVLFGRDIAICGDCFQKDRFDPDDRPVIGEFLRQHHPRLAHEIAVYDMPGSTTHAVFENTGFSDNDRMMIGLLARSHGMPLRDMEVCAEGCIGSGAKPRNTPIFFLMAVLRIADYLDAGMHRAPVSREHLQEISVSISADEWHWNQCINPEECQWDIDHRNRIIDAAPKNSIQFVQLKKWLNSVQEELDICWAVLAEKYTGEPYRLSIHRVVSNIHESTFKDFLPRDARLRANPMILPQLIAPLYGDNPSFGIRELVQNAVDACIEREFFENSHPEGDKNYSGHVKVEIDTKANTFTITDNGIGMNENVLLNHYLCAGASYRLSDEWKEAYTRDNVPQIARTGRFGIGFLAGFLLGDTITVTTRHRKDPRGFRFSFTSQSKPLCIERPDSDSCACGTTISIQMKAGALEKLVDLKNPTVPLIDIKYRDILSLFNGWASPMDSVTCWSKWYAYDDPEVTYFVDGQSVPSADVKLSRIPEKNSDWFEMQTDAYAFYLWKYEPQWEHMTLHHSPKFYCNGIRIYGAPERSITKYGLDISFPQVAVSDPRGNLDIDLARSKVQTFPEEEKLAREICRWHIAQLLMTRWDTPDDYIQNLACGTWYGSDNAARRSRFLLTPPGFQLYRKDICSLISCDRFVALFYNTNSPTNTLDSAFRIVQPGIPISIVFSNRYSPDLKLPHSQANPYFEALNHFVTAFVPGNHNPQILLQGGDPRLCACSNVWIHKELYKSIQRYVALDPPGNGSCPNAQVYAWKLRSKSTPDRGEMPIDTTHFDPVQFPLAVEMTPPEMGNDASLFLRQFQELLTPAPGYPQQDLWIPYSMEERKKKFPKAFEELDYYIRRLSGNP